MSFIEETELGLETPEQRRLGQTLEEVTEILAAALEQHIKADQREVSQSQQELL